MKTINDFENQALRKEENNNETRIPTAQGNQHVLRICVTHVGMKLKGASTLLSKKEDDDGEGTVTRRGGLD